MSQADTELDLVVEPPAEARPPLAVRAAGLTDRGQVRPTNEDHFAVAELARTLHIHESSVPQAPTQYSSRRGHVFLLADGMGGHTAGEVASALTVGTIEGFLLNCLKFFFKLSAPDEHQVMREFRDALQAADARIFEEAERHPEMFGMGTTLTMAFATERRLLVAHAGDSRCYLFSGTDLHQLTRDHTVAAELARRGVIDAGEVARHPYRHVITNVVGGKQPGVTAEMQRFDLEPGDVVLLCSDGLTDALTDEQIAAVLREEAEPRAACARLVAEANERGGRDNITVIVAQFAEP